MTLQVVKVVEGERALWDQAVVTLPLAHPLNAYGWGKVREIDGWKPSYFVAKEGDAVKGMIMVLTKNIPWTGLSIMYAPKGPICELEDHETLKSLLESVREEAVRKRSIFLRIDPNISEDRFNNAMDPFIEEGFIHLEHRWSFWNSPRDVYRIDLGNIPTGEDFFNSIDRDARRCVRKSEKEGVSIRPAESLEELHRFYEIFSQFSVEKGFMCRQLKYQEILWREYIATGNGRLFLAVYNGEIIGGLICLLFGRKCLAMHMGTPPQYSKLQTNYAYVWESIRWAKERGCLWYSFRGVGTTPTQESFKRKFRPRAVALVGYYDLAFRPWLYRVFYSVEFKVLPRIWRTLMRVRRGYKLFVDKTKDNLFRTS
jgi:lipid II:glycine glycyltransferase (peptidoglycan interpeptide bridge formation enzyme)